ncbi:MAG: DMT family transporter [Clostridia bacterium]|nr:DMT family transporter [Clostridia bacterium]
MNRNLAKNSSLALFSGIMIAVMVTANGMLAKASTHWVSLIIIHFAGLTTAGIVLVIRKETRSIFNGVHFVFMLGGALGVFTILLNNLCVNNIGVTLTLGLALVGQIIASGIAEHFGWLGVTHKKLSINKVPAYILMAVGAAVMIVWG